MEELGHSLVPATNLAAEICWENEGADRLNFQWFQQGTMGTVFSRLQVVPDYLRIFHLWIWFNVGRPTPDDPNQELLELSRPDLAQRVFWGLSQLPEASAGLKLSI